MKNLRSKLLSRALLGSAALSLAGCATLVDGAPYKYTDKKGDLKYRDGLVYYLPVSVIVVTPKPDGTAEVKVEHLPDPENAYVLQTKSFGASYTLDVKLDKGMLTTVSLDAKSTDVPSAALEAATSVATKSLEEQNKDQDAKADADKKKQDALAELRLNARIAQDKLDRLNEIMADASNPDLQKSVTPAALLEAELALTEARTKLAQAMGVTMAELSPDAFDAPAPADTAPGPVLFRVNPTSTGVTLTKMDGNVVTEYNSYSAPAATPVPVEVRITQTPPILVEIVDQSQTNFTVPFSSSEFSMKFISASRVKFPNEEDPKPLSDAQWSLAKSESNLEITIPGNMAEGLYTLELALGIGDNLKGFQIDVAISHTTSSD